MIGGGCKGSNVLSLTVLMVEGLTCFRVDISLLIKRAQALNLGFFIIAPWIGAWVVEGKEEEGNFKSRKSLDRAG